MSLKELCDDLEKTAQNVYENGVALDEAEKLAAVYLSALLQISNEIKKMDLDARMRKTGIKALKATVYLDECAKADKKPTEAMLTALVDSNKYVQGEQDKYDQAEVEKEALIRYYDVFNNAHIYFRGVAKGKFE